MIKFQYHNKKSEKDKWKEIYEQYKSEYSHLTFYVWLAENYKAPDKK